MNYLNIFWYILMIQVDKYILNGKSVKKALRKCSFITKLIIQLNNSVSNKLPQSFTSQNHWLKSKYRKPFLIQKIHSEISTIKFHLWFKISQYLWPMIFKCKNLHQFLLWKVNLLLFSSMKIKSLFLTEYFRMKKNTKKTLYFSE